jgi:hypothetical protein
MLGALCANNDRSLPPLATAFLQDTDATESFAKLDPIALAEGKIGDKTIQELLSEVADDK